MSFIDEASVGASCCEGEVLLRYPPARWAGWGCSLAWLGKALGGAPEADAWADLLFTTGDIATGRLWPEFAGRYMPQVVPGLGLSIARYNVGGMGRVEDQAGEARSCKSRGWHAEIEGYQPTPGGEFDWGRDEGQRRFLQLAVERGVDQVEFFANAPMWWMSRSSSSFGGTLSCTDEFAAYLAEVVAYARSNWGIPVVSVSPFNEPSAGWWRYPHDQEGCNISLKEQARVIVRLRDELDRRGLVDIIIATSDENRPDTACTSWMELRRAGVTGYIGRINVHSYNGLSPWRESAHPGCRAALARLAAQDQVPIWMSEHGNKEASGVELAVTILEDLHHLKPAAWVYWQPVEHHCSWGLVEADFNPLGATSLGSPHPKYYVFAHFSRFFRPGCTMLHCTMPWMVAGYSPEEAHVVCVLVNVHDQMSRLKVLLPGFSTNQRTAESFITQPHERRFFIERHADVAAEPPPGSDAFVELQVEVPEKAVCSIVLREVRLASASGDSSTAFKVAGDAAATPASPVAEAVPELSGSGHGQCCYAGVAAAVSSVSRRGVQMLPARGGGGITAIQVREMARHAAWGAANERCYGSSDPQATSEWARWEHECGRAAAALCGSASLTPPPGSAFKDLKEMVCGGAWGAANERAFGKNHAEAAGAWERFRMHGEKVSLGSGCVVGVLSDLQWMVFNLCWEVANERWYGKESKDCQEARERAEQHLNSIGWQTVVLKPC